MNKIVIAAALVAAAAAPQAFAQAKNFEGFSVFGGLNVASSKIEATGTNAASSSSTNVALQAQYAMALGEQFVLGVGATVGAGDLTFATGLAGDIKLKNSAALFLAPGFAVSNSTLVYGKIATTSGTVYDNSGSLNVTGAGYGIGAQFKSGNNLFYQVEYLQNNFADKANNGGTIFKTSTGGLSFGVGYKF